MKTFICTDHDGHWPVGVASVVKAKDRRRAKKLLDDLLKADGLQTSKTKSYTLEEVKDDSAIILCNGDY